MSDPSPNVEIEDVLSSIRRLVSEDVKASPRSGVKAKAARTRTSRVKSELLVLTPAQLVSSDGEPSQAYEKADKNLDLAESELAPTDAPAQMASLEDTIAELEAAVAGSDEEFEPDGGEDTDVGQLAESLAEVSDATAQPIVADSPDVTEEKAEADLNPAETSDSGANETVQVVLDDEPVSVDEAEAINTSAAAEAVEVDLGDAPTSNDDTQPSSIDVPVAPISVADVDGAIDETVVRDLVRKIVREELRGELGERMTQSIRKLVRREIHRVMAAHDLD